MDGSQYVCAIERSALKVWSDLLRDAQEQLFTAAVDWGIIASSLADSCITVIQEPFTPEVHADGVNVRL